ncbi:isopropylmalate synthase [Solibacillus sp. FSL K6-1523]|uniref:isopropylmalate synthase n=1 Tax=Solibacillus sp. FSL K6-1523 TaxID=2921471 RepID=UPI0030F5F7B4
MNKLEWFENLQHMDDHELRKFAKKEDLKFSIEEIRQLRLIFQNASFTWLFSGIPAAELKKAEALIGEKRLKKLRKVIGM